MRRRYGSVVRTPGATRCEEGLVPMAFFLCRSRATQALGVVAALVLMVLPSATLAQEPGEGGGPTTSAVAASQVNTLAPIASLLSGRAGLIVSGQDPVFQKDRGESEGGGGGEQNSAITPVNQGGGVLVPFRNPG